MTKDQESKLKRKCEIELIQKTIKLLHIKQQKADERIATLKLNLKDKLNMSRNWIENTVQWLTKKAEKKGEEKKKILKRKFQQLNEEKIKFDKELNDFMAQQRTQNSNLNKKVVYNNSSKQLFKSK